MTLRYRVSVMPTYLYRTGVLRVPQHLLPACELKCCAGCHDEVRTRERHGKRDRPLWETDQSKRKRHWSESSYRSPTGIAYMHTRSYNTTRAITYVVGLQKLTQTYKGTKLTITLHSLARWKHHRYHHFICS